MTDSRDLPECTGFDLLFQEQVNRVAAHEIPGLEKNARLFDRVRHLQGILCRKTERFFDEHMFSRFRCAKHQLLVTVGFRADDDRVNGGIIPDFSIGIISLCV